MRLVQIKNNNFLGRCSVPHHDIEKIEHRNLSNQSKMFHDYDQANPFVFGVKQTLVDNEIPDSAAIQCSKAGLADGVHINHKSAQ